MAKVSETAGTAQVIAPRVAQPADSAGNGESAEDHPTAGPDHHAQAAGARHEVPAGAERPPPGLVVTGQNSACNSAELSAADILGFRFPGLDDVTAAAEALRSVATESPLHSLIEVSPGSIRFRHTVPPEADPDVVLPSSQSGAGRKAITGWTLKSRRQMLRSFAALDYGPIFADNGIPARLTLTYPGDWLTVAPTRLAVQRHFKILERRFVRAWDQPLIGLWKLEYQEREAPHYHLFIRRPNGTAGQARRARYEAHLIAWELSGHDGPRPRYRRSPGDGLRFKEWISEVWADVVHHPDPEQRTAHAKAGTQVEDVKDTLAASDPKKASIYFSKHGAVKGDKEYQNKPPTAWTDAGSGPGRYWGYLGLKPMIAAAKVNGGRGRDYYVAKRTMRRYAARARYWDDTKRQYVWVGSRKRVVIQRRDRKTGQLVPITVRGPKPRLRGLSGTLCVNNGPAIAADLARVIALTVPAAPKRPPHRKEQHEGTHP